MEQLWPTVPHQVCQFHVLREASRPGFEADRKVKTALRKRIGEKIRVVMRQWVLDAEHILSGELVPEGSVVTNALIAQRFDTWREGLTCQLAQGVLSAQQQQCLEQFLQVLSNQRSHLIQCYDHRNFPRTNNEMEGQIRAIKTRYRRISGRKNWNNYVLRYGRYVAYYDWWEQDAQRSCQFLHQAARVDRAQWRQERRESRSSRSSQLKRFRFCHKRPVFLASLQARWDAAASTSVLP